MNHSCDWLNTVKRLSCAPCLLCPVAPSLPLHHPHHDTQLALMQRWYRIRLSHGPVVSAWRLDIQYAAAADIPG